MDLRNILIPKNHQENIQNMLPANAYRIQSTLQL